MAEQTLGNIKIGNHHSDKVVSINGPGCRSQAQLDAVCKLHSTDPSAWWCINSFEPNPDGRVYKCTFRHIYYDHYGSLTVVSITPTGKMSEPVKAPVDPQNVTEVIAKYGTFQGCPF